MPKLIKCPICGRQNSINNIKCSNCGTNLDIAIKEEIPNYPIEKIKEKDVENILKNLNIDLKKPKQKLSFEILNPTETKLFLFVNLVFTSLFLHLLVKYKIIFILTFYPTLYWFSCYWATRKTFEWASFLYQFVLLIFSFLSIFYLVPTFLISS